MADPDYSVSCTEGVRSWTTSLTTPPFEMSKLLWAEWKAMDQEEEWVGLNQAYRDISWRDAFLASRQGMRCTFVVSYSKIQEDRSFRRLQAASRMFGGTRYM